MLRCAQHDSVVTARHVVQGMAPVLALGVARVLLVETKAPGCHVNAREKKPVASQPVAQPKLIRG